MSDLIRIVDLEIITVIGVTDQERARAQKLLLTVELRLKDIGPAAFTDNVNLTVDYAAVAERAKMMAQTRPRHLIEALGEEIAADLLKAFPHVTSLKLELKKFVLPGADRVELVIERPIERAPSAYRPSATASLRMTRDPFGR